MNLKLEGTSVSRLGEPRRVIDGHMEKFVADPSAPPPPIAVDAMPDDAAEAFEIDVEEIADPRPLIALHRPTRFDQGHPIQPGAPQHACDRRAWDAQRRADLPGRGAGPSQRDDRRFSRHARAARLALGPRRPIRQGGPIAGEPLRDGPDAHAERFGRLPLRPALMPYTTGAHAEALIRAVRE